MSFKCGWQAGGFFVAYIFVVSFVVRFIFGDHTLAQAGTECATLGLYCGAVYTFGYYVSRPLISDGWMLLYTIGAVVGMWMLGHYMHAAVAASFTSTFFLIVYALLGGLMGYLGFDDERSESYMNFLAANNML